MSGVCHVMLYTFTKTAHNPSKERKVINTIPFEKLQKLSFFISGDVFLNY